MKVYFYCIYENEVPVYVGMTTRSIQARFNEHVKDKNLEGDFIVKLIHTIEYFDTDLDKSAHWNMCRFANFIDKEEERLIIEYYYTHGLHKILNR